MFYLSKTEHENDQAGISLSRFTVMGAAFGLAPILFGVAFC